MAEHYLRKTVDLKSQHHNLKSIDNPNRIVQSQNNQSALDTPNDSHKRLDEGKDTNSRNPYPNLSGQKDTGIGLKYR